MKQYVLDEPGPRPTLGAAPAPARSRRPVVLAAAVAAALVASYAFVEGRSESRPAATEAAVVPVYVAPAAVAPPRSAAVVAPVAASIVAPAAVAEPILAPVASMPADLPPSRVAREKGRYVVDLHGAAVGPALAMLSEATHATVSGSDIVAASPVRITSTFVADSPLEAWKGVFGDVASFAMSCGASGCAVRFVSLVGERPQAPSPSFPSPTVPAAVAPPSAAVVAPVAESSEGQPAMPDN